MSEARLILHPVCGNPWQDEAGNTHVECPACFHKYMRKLKWLIYRCGKCGREWEIKT